MVILLEQNEFSEDQVSTDKTAPGPFFIAVILYESKCSGEGYRPLYEESFVLISAASEDEAREKAHTYAEDQQSTYQNEQGETITWSVKHVVDVSSVLSDDFVD